MLGGKVVVCSVVRRWIKVLISFVLMLCTAEDGKVIRCEGCGYAGYG